MDVLGCVDQAPLCVGQKKLDICIPKMNDVVMNFFYLDHPDNEKKEEEDYNCLFPDSYIQLILFNSNFFQGRKIRKQGIINIIDKLINLRLIFWYLCR